MAQPMNSDQPLTRETTMKTNQAKLNRTSMFDVGRSVFSLLQSSTANRL